MNLFFLVSELDTAASARLLVCCLPREKFTVTVGLLGASNRPGEEALRAAGVAVVPVAIRSVFDFSGMKRLRHQVKNTHAHVVHAFGEVALRAARLVVARDGEANAPRLVVSAAHSISGGLGGWLAARMLCRAERVIATGRGEGERYRKCGVRSDRLSLIAPGVSLPGEAPERGAFCREIGAPADALFIYAGGRLDFAHGIKDAVVAFDMLRYEYPKLQLVLTGEGPERRAALELGHALAFDDCRVRFSGVRADIAEATRLAELVLVPCQRGGEHLALAAMAAARPVVAYRTPELTEIIDEGVTGLLVPPGDRAALAAAAQKLLSDPSLARSMGEAGQTRVKEHFSAARMVDQHARIYQELT